MKISWKSFFLSFGVALVVFAILMACICADIFRDFVPYPQRSEGESSLVKTRESYESYLFYCNDKEGASLEFAVLARVDQKEKCILVTELYGDDLLECDDSLFYIRSLCQDNGVGELSRIFAALTGYVVPADRILNARTYFSGAVKDATVRYLDFLDILPSVFENTEDFSVVECALITEENHGIRMIDMEQSLDSFQILK